MDGGSGGGDILPLVSPLHRRVMRYSRGSVLRAIWDQTRSDRFNKPFSGDVTVLCSTKDFLHHFILHYINTLHVFSNVVSGF